MKTIVNSCRKNTTHYKGALINEEQCIYIYGDTWYENA